MLHQSEKGPLTLQELFDFIQRRGAERVQLIRVTGTGRLDATINPKDSGNILILLEINPNKGIVQ